MLGDGGYEDVGVGGDSREERVGGDILVDHAQARTPVNCWLPNIPSFTEPVSESPFTTPENASVIGIGRLMDDFQLILLPSTVPSSIGLPSPEPALCVPVSVAPD